MKNNNELNYFNETRKQELDKMIADFSDEGCMFVEDMFTEFNACFRRGYDRSNGRMTVSFGDELGNDLTFILSREEIEYVTAGVTEKLDNLVCDSFTPYEEDDAEKGTMVKKKIVPYFRDTGLTLGSIQAKHIQSFYLHELKSVSASTVIHEHANIHKALKYAVKMDLIPFNPADKVERPKKQKYIADYYRLDELEKLFEVTKDHPYSLLIQMTAFYGLRRSEALGLKWDAIDFERNTITIRHIVTETEVDGKSVIISEDRAKTKSSLRSLPLVGHFREKLLELKEQQKENKRVCGNCYSYDYDGYIFVDAMGTIFNPNAVTENFSKILKRNGLRHIRFHDLRHSCASLLLANDVPMKQIQEWLGHSDISTTANIYSHLDYKSKITSANVMDNILVLPDSKSPGW